jgi:hypothetical protein
MKRAAVINCSAPHYNLGSHKLADWLRGSGYEVELFDGDPGLFVQDVDLVCVSVIFSWHAPIAADIAHRFLGKSEVWAGGPGLFKLADWWKSRVNELQCKLVLGLDHRFERQRGSYRVTFASRGCPVNCWYCPVTPMEGREFTLYHDFDPAPILCDNNLSALPEDFQAHIVERYLRAGVSLLDANSGFEAKAFTVDTYNRWKPALRGAWRTAFDILPRHRAVEQTLRILAAEPQKRKRVYVLIGNEPMESCFERATRVLEWGAEPHCQAVMPLDVLEKDAFTIRYDWTVPRLKHFARYFNRFLWKYTTLADYRCGDLAPFQDFKFAQYRLEATA